MLQRFLGLGLLHILFCFFLSTFCSCWAVFLALESPTSSILCFDWGLFVPN